MYTCPCSEQRFLFNSCDGVCFQTRSLSFHIARKCNNGMFFKSMKVKTESAYQSAFRQFLFFFFSILGLTYFLLHFATQMSFLLLSLFLFRKMWKLFFFCCSHHISRHGYPKSYPGHGTWGGCVVINTK